MKGRMTESKAQSADGCRGSEHLPCRELLVRDLPALFFPNGKMNQEMHMTGLKLKCVNLRKNGSLTKRLSSYMEYKRSDQVTVSSGKLI